MERSVRGVSSPIDFETKIAHAAAVLANKGSALQSTLGHAADARMAVFVNVYVCVSECECERTYDSGD